MEVSVGKLSNVFREGEDLLIDDVRQRAQVSRYAASGPPVGALRVVCAERGLPRDLRVMRERCAAEAGKYLFHRAGPFGAFRLWLFVAHAAWRPATRVARHKKLWRSLEPYHPLGRFRRGEEVEFASASGLRYAGTAEVGPDNFNDAVHLLSSEATCSLVYTGAWESPSAEAARSLFAAAFGGEGGEPETRINWPGFVARMCPEGHILMKAGGSWDERAVSLDLFGKAELIDLLAESRRT